MGPLSTRFAARVDLCARNIGGTQRTIIQPESDRTEGMRSPKREMVATGLRKDHCDDASRLSNFPTYHDQQRAWAAIKHFDFF